MLSNDEGDSGINRSTNLLSKIAETLNCSISDFTDKTSFELEKNIELLQLWSKLKHEQDRNMVLSFVRTAVQNQT